MKRYIRLTLAIGLISSAGFVRAEKVVQTPQPQTLEERLAILERKVQLDQEAAPARAKDGSGAVARDGFAVKSNDGLTQLKISGLIQADYRASNSVDQFLLRRVRPTIEGTINKVLDFRITPEFASSFQLLDAYGEIKTFPWFKVRAGKFTPPLGLERLQSGSAITFVERAHPTSLVPNRDTGLQVSGDSANGVFSYQAALFNGVVDGGTGETDTTDDKDFVGRIFTHPFKTSSSDWINGLGIGAAASIGHQEGATASGASQLPSFRTPAQQTFFSYTAGATPTIGDGRRTRVVPQAYWYIGSLGLLGECALSSQEVTRVAVSTTSATINNRAWQAAVSYVVTGERASFRGVKPRQPFDPKNGGWGALELAGRYSELRVDDEAFPRYASLTTSAKRSRSWTGGFNWYLSNNTKIVTDYEYTTFTGGSVNGNRPHERAALARLQFTY